MFEISKLRETLWRPNPEEPGYHVAAAIFSRALAFIYMIAFASFGIQALGLVGSNGILPVAEYLRIASQQLGSSAVWKVPTIFWWARSDFALLSISWGGVALSAIAILARPHSVWQRAIFVLLFGYYLSIVSAGQIFMSYQWDLLLLETGFLAIFLVASRPRIWLFQWLLFRLMFESGVVKLTSHDPTWRDFSALSFHYWTQPLPTVIGWFAAHLPFGIQQASTVMVFVVELLLPLAMLGPRNYKQIAAFGTVGLQVLILLTGNYTFFNWLAIALCLFLFDDRFFSSVRGRSIDVARGEAKSNRWVSAVLFVFVMTVSCVEFSSLFQTVSGPLGEVVGAQAPFGLVNGYGLFASMTTSRPEVEIEGSNDGQNWQAYTFKYKAGPLNRAPGWVAPFQPRLDWQMWFAALGNYRENPWLVRFMLKLLQGSRPVLALMEHDPFGGAAPKHVRAMVYDYRPAGIEEWRKTGNWWTRELKGMYFPPVSLKGPGDQ